MKNENDLLINIENFVENDARKRSASRISLDAGLSRDFIRNILNEKSKNPSNRNLELLAKTLGTDLATLLGPAKAAEVKEREENTIERKRESMKMTDLLISLHEEAKGKDSHAIMLKNEDIYRQIVALRHSPKKISRSQKISIESVNTRFKSLALDTSIKVIGGKRRLVSQDGSGVWRVKLNSGGILHIGKVNISKNLNIEFLVGTEKDIIDLKMILTTGKSKLVINPPKKGIWNLNTTFINGESLSHFVKWNLDKENAKKFDTHPAYSEIFKGIQEFFENTERWTRLGGSGTRKFLLYGPPGTGKTQMISCLASNFNDTLLVVRVSGADEMIDAAHKAAKKNRKTIIICEELDAIRKGYAGSVILNFLDGADTPRNTAGTFIIFTTNYPRDIDPRILKRPGRIDKSVKIGALNDSSVVDIAKMYLPEESNLTDKEIKTALKKTTAAELKEIINDSISVAISENIEFDFDLLIRTRSRMKERMANSSLDDDYDDIPELRESKWKETKNLEDPMDWLTDEEKKDLDINN